jgi:uncharacterized membrane protein
VVARHVLLGAALVGTGLNAGLLWAYQTSVVPALRQVADVTYLEAFQRINVAIENPVFGAVFAGTPIVLVAATAAVGNPLRSRPAALLAAASAVFAVGVLGVTAARNLPLNDRMASVDLAIASDEAVRQVRHAVESSWARWNGVRAFAAVASFGLAVAAAVDGTRA